MKTLKYFILLSLINLFASSRAQKEDYVWLQGYSSGGGLDTFTNKHFGISVMDFNYSPRHIYYDSLGMNFSRANTSYCDDNGNLLFYTNGIYVANALDEKIENGDSLNAGALQYWWDPSITTDGYRATQAFIAIKRPGQTNKYYLLHTYVDTLDGGASLIVKNLYYTYLDMDANNGHGRVISKNQLILTGNLGSEISAIRHANGRDWWMFVQKRNSNCYYKVLITGSGIYTFPGYSCGGSSTAFGYLGTTCYSSDGTKFVYVSDVTGVNIFDFDRCSGDLSNPLNIALPSGMYGAGVAISPNNRFLYVGAATRVYQYDLSAPDIAASIDTVAIYDGFQAPFGSYFQTMQSGPDGKIYESCGNSEYVYHVIESPDEKGDSCHFIQHGIELPSFCHGVPNFPNYRLGALVGSPCDTLGLGIDQVTREEQVRVFPNPASEVVTIDYGFIDWSKGEPYLEITNILGHIAYTQKLPMYSALQRINVSGFAAGFYTAIIRRNGQILAAAKFSKQ